MNYEQLAKFHKENYKKLLLIPLALFILATLIIVITYIKTGDFINKDVTLKGGVTATIYAKEEINLKDLEAYLDSQLKTKVSIRRIVLENQNGAVIEAPISLERAEELKGIIKNKIDFDAYTTEEVSPSLGKSFYKELLYAIIFAFLLMSITVFLVFRNVFVSLIVILSVFFDIYMTLATVNFLGIQISTAGITAFLLLIGYSVDTDILLATKMIKRKEGELFSRILDASKTGWTMSATTLAVSLTAFLFTNSTTIKQIFLITSIGLVFDFISTWVDTLGILRWRLEK